MLKLFLALKPETEMLKSKKGKVMNEISHEKWVWDLA
jgi:hypothetical protein